MLKYIYVFAPFIVALLLCLFPMPKGYIPLIHLAPVLIFRWMAYRNYQDERKGMTLLYIFLFILYLPFKPIDLANELWYIVYIITIFLLLWNLYKEVKQIEVWCKQAATKGVKKRTSVRFKKALDICYGRNDCYRDSNIRTKKIPICWIIDVV